MPSENVKCEYFNAIYFALTNLFYKYKNLNLISITNCNYSIAWSDNLRNFMYNVIMS